MTLTLNRAYRTPVASVGNSVIVQIAARLIRDEGLCVVLDYCGHHINVRPEEVTGCINKQDHLMQVTAPAIVTSHDGRASYIVELGGRRVPVHEQQISAVAKSEQSA